MLTVRKFALRSSIAGSMALLCVALLHTSAADSLDQGRSSSAVNTFADTAIYSATRPRRACSWKE